MPIASDLLADYAANLQRQYDWACEAKAEAEADMEDILSEAEDAGIELKT